MDTALKIEKLELLVSEQAATIAKLETLVAYYSEQFRLAQHRRFCPSSEKSGGDIRQLNLYGELFGLDASAPKEPETEEVTYRRKKQKGKREADLSGLPVTRVDYELPANQRGCPECGGEMADIGVKIRKELKVIPAEVVVEEHAVHTYACKNCGGEPGRTSMAAAAAPKPLISGSLASASLAAYIIVQKYLNGMPLYRIENGFVLDGITVSRQTMCNWVIKCVETYLLAIYNRLVAYLLKESVLHADETTLRVLHEPGRKAQTKSCEWLYRTSGFAEHPVIIYDYKQTRQAEHPKAFLAEFKGFLHTDGYQGYHDLPSDITVVGCWQHAGQDFNDALKIIPKEKRSGSDAARGVAYINTLFRLEREFDGLSPEERCLKRLEKSKPVADEFFAWVTGLGALPKSLLGQAAGYALNQRKYLLNVYLDGRLELSNNRAERSIKTFVMGRKSWLFSNTPNGADASSVLYSIVETAKANGLHPFHYLTFLLERLPNATTSEIEALLPWSRDLPSYCRAVSNNASG